MTRKQRKPVLSRVIEIENRSRQNGLRQTVYMPNGNTYRGEWSQGLKSGLGVLSCSDKTVYEGTWSKNLKHGWGKVSEAKNGEHQLVYTGEMVIGSMHGTGYQHAIDGSYYEGTFNNGCRSGYGKCWYKDQSFYAGHWKDNVRDGQGLLVLVNGNRYEGNWRNGEKDGPGTFYHLDSAQIQKGLWRNGIPVTSTIEDLPHRTSSSHTKLPIPPLELDPTSSCMVFLNSLRVS